MSESKEPIPVTNLREYLKIKSVQPNPDYSGCVELLKELYGDIGLDITLTEVVKGKPILTFTKVGKEPSLPSILLNSHMDVVPADKSRWKHDPFSGDKDSEGRIYGRGSQDVKSLGIIQLEAMRKLKNTTLPRTVQVSFVPDEEIGGADGMAAWVKTDDFRSLNVGCSLDESVIVDMPVYPVFHSERSKWGVKVTCTGQSGHGSSFHSNTAEEKLITVLKRVSEYRSVEVVKFKEHGRLGNWAQSATSINLTIIQGGSHHNVLPSEITVNYDCRLAPTLDFDQFTTWFENVCKEAGEGVTVEFIKSPKWPISPTDDSNIYWKAFKAATDKLGMTILPVTCPGTTDGRYLREVGITSYGFTPMCQTPTLLHDHNEFIYEDQFMKGIDIMEEVVVSLASAPTS